MTKVLKFQSSDATEIELLVKSLAEKKNLVLFSNHAKERMEERDILNREVYRVLTMGHLVGGPRIEGDEITCKMVRDREGSNRDIGVVTLILKQRRLLIKTVEFEDLA